MEKTSQASSLGHGGCVGWKGTFQIVIRKKKKRKKNSPHGKGRPSSWQKPPPASGSEFCTHRPWKHTNTNPCLVSNCTSHKGRIILKKNSHPVKTIPTKRWMHFFALFKELDSRSLLVPSPKTTQVLVTRVSNSTPTTHTTGKRNPPTELQNLLRPWCYFFASWYFKPSQPQRITSGLKQTSICLLFTLHTSHQTTKSPPKTENQSWYKFTSNKTYTNAKH